MLLTDDGEHKSLQRVARKLLFGLHSGKMIVAAMTKKPITTRKLKPRLLILPCPFKENPRPEHWGR